MNATQLSTRLQDPLHDSLGNLLGLPKVARRFCLEALHGTTTRPSLFLSKIGRSLNENNELIQTEKRLSRHASREALWLEVSDFVARESAHKVGRDALLVIDPSDLAKKYGRQMEHVGSVAFRAPAAPPRYHHSTRRSFLRRSGGVSGTP